MMMSSPKPLQAEFSAKVKRLEEEKRMPLISPTIELAREEAELIAEQRGKVSEAQRIVIQLLNYRIREIELPLIEQVRELPVEQLEQLVVALMDFSTVDDLHQWLESRPTPNTVRLRLKNENT
jgi:hypothetical protein